MRIDNQAGKQQPNESQNVDGRDRDEDIEIEQVAPAYALGCPWAVVVVLADAHIALGAVVGTALAGGTAAATRAVFGGLLGLD